MEKIKNHLWNKKRTETLKVADLQGYLAQFDPGAEIQLGVVQCGAQRCGATRSKASNSFSVAQYRHC